MNRALGLGTLLAVVLLLCPSVARAEREECSLFHGRSNDGWLCYFRMGLGFGSTAVLSFPTAATFQRGDAFLTANSVRQLNGAALQRSMLATLTFEFYAPIFGYGPFYAGLVERAGDGVGFESSLLREGPGRALQLHGMHYFSLGAYAGLGRRFAWFGIRAEGIVGYREHELKVDVFEGERTVRTNFGVLPLQLEARTVLDFWVHPAVCVSAMAGIDMVALPAVTLGLNLRFAILRHDGV